MSLVLRARTVHAMTGSWKQPFPWPQSQPNTTFLLISRGFSARGRAQAKVGTPSAGAGP